MIGPLKFLGKKHVEIASRWVGSAGVYGAAAGTVAIYMTDWKLVLQYLPYYNGKFPKVEE